MPRFDLIIFDCDGTLVDSETFNNQVTCDMLAELGMPQYDLAYAMKYHAGLKLSEIIKNISAETGFTFPENFSKEYIRRVNEGMAEHIKPVDGVTEAVGFAAGIAKVCVVSNGERNNVLTELKIAGLEKFFPEENVITGLMPKKPKPAPDPFLLAAEMMDSSPDKTLVVEDSPSGIQAGKAAGMETWGFVGTAADPKAHTQSLKKAGADRIIDRLIHIPELLSA